MLQRCKLKPTYERYKFSYRRILQNERVWGQKSCFISRVRLLCESKECRNEQKGKGRRVN